MKKPKIVIVGSSNTDMVVKVPRIPIPGETIIGSEFMVIPGGKGANQAVAAARAGAEVTFISCVGDDQYGYQSIENYKKEGIDTSYIKIEKGAHSGIALITVSQDGENSIAVAPGANNDLAPEDIEKYKEAFTDAKLILVQLEIPMSTVEAVIDLANSMKIPLMLNPAPGASIPSSYIEKITWITPNESEASILTSKNNLSGNNIEDMACELYKMGAGTVLITLGKNGVYLKNDEYQEKIDSYQVKAIDTTAAGDVFNGTLAFALASEMPLIEAVDFAQRAAAISVTRMGAQPSAPFSKEINDFKALILNDIKTN